MKFDISKINYSQNDIKNKTIIPKKMNLELAEFLGIIVGDGHVGKSGHRRQVGIYGNINDKAYYKEYVNPLINRIFNISFNINYYKPKNTILVRKQSKAIYEFLNKIIKIPPRKDNIQVPQCIIENSRQIKAAFLRGLADADFCFTVKYKPNKYPLVYGASKSKILIEQCSHILDELGIKNNVLSEFTNHKKFNKKYLIHRVYINGFSRVEKYMSLVGFSNTNKKEKYTDLEGLPKYRT